MSSLFKVPPSLPLHVVRKEGVSVLYLVIPPDLSFAVVRDIMKKSQACSIRTKANFQAHVTNQIQTGKKQPRFVACLQTWSRKEGKLVEDLQGALRSMLIGPMVPIVHI
jgi:hypothetical protein